MRVLKITTLFLFLIGMALHGKEERDCNHLVLQAVASMPSGGGYATTALALTRFREAVVLTRTSHSFLLQKPGSPMDGALGLNLDSDSMYAYSHRPTSSPALPHQLSRLPRHESHEISGLKQGTISISSSAKPSFCSEATYLVFLKTIMLLQEQKKCLFSSEILEALLPRHNAEGEGCWGRWNANGPGVARLFEALDLGPNFTDLAAAQPGDFLKIFWSEEIGMHEHGHLVIYLGSEKRGDKTYLHCWSSNQPDGYGMRLYPLDKMHHLIFSRLTNPDGLHQIRTLPKKDFYLASLLFRATSWDEVKGLLHHKSIITPSPSPSKQ